MNELYIVIIGLGVCLLTVIGLLVYQQIFFSGQIKGLIERLMSRSLHEYESAKNPPPPRVIVKHEEPTEDLGRIF